MAKNTTLVYILKFLMSLSLHVQFMFGFVDFLISIL